MAELGSQALGQGNQHGRADKRSPQGSNAAEKRQYQCLRGNHGAQHAMRRDHLQHHRVEPPHQCAQGATGDEPGHLDAQRVDARCLRRQLILLDRQHGETETRALHHQRDQQGRRHEAHANQGIHPGIGELHEADRLIAPYREGELLPAHPVEHEDEQQRVGKHGECEVVPPQAERDRSDQHTRGASDESRNRQPEPRRDTEFDGQQGDRERAQPKKRGMAERDKTGVAAEQVPAQRKRRPDRHRAENQLVIGILDEGRRGRHQHSDHQDHGQGGALERTGQHQVRSALRPNRPCGRNSTTARNNRKMVAFCS